MHGTLVESKPFVGGPHPAITLADQFVAHANEGKPLEYAVPTSEVRETIEKLIADNNKAMAAFEKLDNAGLWKGFDEIESPWLNWSR